ncbi:MAG: toll/interleukin-1 receptor domain-containing protein, partial [Cyanobacteriota bacterium]|nr:toll/interleukin-1 receptor domain-containing protein [Cyanobacteriota bacterium]
MARIFLSHASGDNLAASRIKAWLEEQGFLAAFLDFDSTDGIPPGADWEKTLYREMERCQALLILQTPNWSASRWCFAEFAQARALGKPIFQVVEDDPSAAEAPIAPDLQRLDLRRDRQANLRQLRRELERLALQDQGGFAWPPAGEPNRPPFPGLMVFEAEDAAVFFGRDEDWRAVIERLNTRRVQGGPRLLVLQGSSGSGKSSLLRAGVLPRLRRAGRQWLVLPTLRPQLRPLESLAQTLAVALGRPEAWRELHRQLAGGDDPAELRSHWAGWVADLRLAARAPEAQLLLPIDQGEELFAVAEAPERERLLAVLADALKQPLPLQALMTIRADAMGHLQAVTVLAKTFEAMPLAPLSLERYREIIEGPARLAGLRVEAAFVERAIRDTSTEDALPLLAFALRQLHDRYGAAGQLSLNDYLALGDARSGLSPLENAVRRAADGVVTLSTNPEALRALRQAFVPAMVQVSEKGAFTRRAALWDALPDAARPLLEALVAARLLVRRQAEGQPSTVEVAHEALLRVWPLLRGWLEESRDFLLGSQQLEQDLALWQAAAPADQPQALLSGLKLAKGSAWLAECADQLRPDLRRFILASQRRARLQRGLLLASAAVVGMALTGAAGVAHWQLRQTRITQALRFSVTHQALLSSDPFMSVVYGLAAAKSLIGQRDPWAAAQLSQSLSQALEANVARSAPIATGQGEVINLVALPNGDVLSAGGRGIVRRWRGERPLDGGKLVVSGQRVVMSLAVLPNGEVVSGGQDGTL